MAPVQKGTDGQHFGHCRKSALDNTHLFFSLQISEIVGYEIKPTETTSLSNMLEIGFGKFIEK